MSKDIRLSVSFFNHPKTIKLRSLLGDAGVISLLRLWCYAGEWKQSGDLSGMTADEIECAALFTGPHGEFMNSIMSTRFLDENKCLHDWSEHNPYAFYAPIRRIKAQISAHLKHGDEESANLLRKQHGLHAKRMRNALRPTANRTANRNAPNPIPAPVPTPAPDPAPNPVPALESINTLSGKPDFESIISYLNAKTNQNYKHTGKDTRKYIQARWNDGFRLSDFQKVIDTMSAKWLTDPKYSQYLRPSTLFGTKFESYLNAKVTASDRGMISPMTEKNITVAHEWLERKKAEANHA